MKFVFLTLLLCASFLMAFSQDSTSVSDTLRKDALNVYMDASDYIRKEIPYINYVRDLKDAAVYIISTYQKAGSGGWEYTYFLVGQHEYAGMKDTVSFVAPPDETTEGIRAKEVEILKIGLMRYVAKTPLSKYIKITFTEPLSETVSTDKWNSWVFKTSLNGYFDGQKSYKSKYINLSASANRVTEDLKVNLNVNYSYSKDKFEIGDETVSSDNNSKSFNALVVKSISDHWSYGGSLYLGSSSYSNLEISLRAMPGIEYDLFPYSESTRRQFRLLYKAGFNHVQYLDTTIYNKTQDNLWLHSFSAAYEVVQKWGSIDINLEYENYLHDFSKNSVSLDGYVSLRIAKGLSVSLSGGISILHNQIGLVKGGATAEEILLRRKELETQYEYYTSFGLSYTFGSIYNNVVNPRFGSSSGGGVYMFY